MEEDNIIVKWAQEDVETSYNLLNNFTLLLGCIQYQMYEYTHHTVIWTNTPLNRCLNVTAITQGLVHNVQIPV